MSSLLIGINPVFIWELVSCMQQAFSEWYECGDLQWINFP